MKPRHIIFVDIGNLVSSCTQIPRHRTRAGGFGRSCSVKHHPASGWVRGVSCESRVEKLYSAQDTSLTT